MVLGKSHAFTVLGLKAGSSVEEVKQAFRRKAKALHPDTAAADSVDGTAFAELREAYDVALGRAGAGDDATGARPDAASPYGPGMRARFEAGASTRPFPLLSSA